MSFVLRAGMVVLDSLVFIADLLWIGDGVRWLWRHINPNNVEWRSFPDDDDE